MLCHPNGYVTIKKIRRLDAELTLIDTELFDPDVSSGVGDHKETWGDTMEVTFSKEGPLGSIQELYASIQARVDAFELKRTHNGIIPLNA